MWELTGCLNQRHPLDLDPALTAAVKVTQLLS